MEPSPARTRNEPPRKYEMESRVTPTGLVMPHLAGGVAHSLVRKAEDLYSMTHGCYPAGNPGSNTPARAARAASAAYRQARRTGEGASAQRIPCSIGASQ